MQKIWSVWIAAVLGQLVLAAQREPACAGRRGCAHHKSGSGTISFTINNTTLSVTASSPSLILKCSDNNGRLDVAAMPTYNEVVVFEKIYITGCLLGNASVAGVLGALNVREREVLTLKLYGITETLRADQFAGLNITELLLWRESTETVVRLEEDFFTVFKNLISLNTHGIQYDRPPTGLVKWESVNATLKRLYADSVSTLTRLTLTEPMLTNVSALSAATRLEELYLWAPVGELPLPPALPALRSLTLHNWQVSQTEWPGVESLDELKVEMSSLELLPERWLNASPRLHKLELRDLPLRRLPETLLYANPELRELMISNCGLTPDMLPDKLLDKNVKLDTLDLSHNNLTSLPRDRLFQRLKSLATLNLSHNNLSVPPDAAPFLRDNESLRTLKLDYNPLGDLCSAPRAGALSPAHSDSWLRELSRLSKLSLQHTGATRLCADWLYGMPNLRTLDLQHNNFTELRLADMRPVRDERVRAAAEIRLQHNPLTRIAYSADEYRDAIATSQKAQATVKIGFLSCDCFLYLFAKALKKNPDHVRVPQLACMAAPGRPAEDLNLRRLEELRCDANCSAGCTCLEVPERDGVLAACTRLPADLARPRDDNLEVVELSLAGAGLSALPAADALPPGLRRLDLRNNSIAGAPEHEARALLGRVPQLRLRLAGNPLQCRCGERALVDLLLQHKERVDFEDLVCSDGSVPEPAECGLRAWVVALLGVVGALALAGVLLLGALAHPRLRARLKTALRVLGVRVPAPGAGPARRYDAFVSFAEADARWVARTLVPALEGGPRPRRLCLHYRDWAVGEFIPRQIATSVRDARRTLLVVSDAFARSAWARAEFDEAMAAASRDGRPPPLVLLLSPPEPSALAAAPALAEYLRAATYLRADDPRFRDKLRAAVPAQRARAPDSGPPDTNLPH